MSTKKDHARLKWGGLIVRAVQAYGKLLEAGKMEQVAKDIAEMKPFIIKKWSRKDAKKSKTK